MFFTSSDDIRNKIYMEIPEDEIKSLDIKQRENSIDYDVFIKFNKNKDENIKKFAKVMGAINV